MVFSCVVDPKSMYLDEKLKVQEILPKSHILFCILLRKCGQRIPRKTHWYYVAMSNEKGEGILIESSPSLLPNTLLKLVSYLPPCYIHFIYYNNTMHYVQPTVQLSFSTRYIHRAIQLNIRTPPMEDQVRNPPPPPPWDMNFSFLDPSTM